jgi:hypothetical protein
MYDAERLTDLLFERWERLGVDGVLPEERDYLLLWELNAEVSNGTFDQYLTNNSGDHAPEALATLQRIGCTQLAGILQRVLALLPDGWCLDRRERSRRVSLVADHYHVFRALTDEYYATLELESPLIQRAATALYPAYQRAGLAG